MQIDTVNYGPIRLSTDRIGNTFHDTRSGEAFSVTHKTMQRSPVLVQARQALRASDGPLAAVRAYVALRDAFHGQAPAAYMTLPTGSAAAA